MKMDVLDINGEVHLLDKKYQELDGFFIIQIKFKLYINHWELHYILSILIKEPFIKLKDFSIKCVYSSSIEKSIVIRPEQMIEDYGLIKTFNWFKEVIFEMLEEELDKDDYSHLRLLLLPL
jgi:hypothetical protein